MGRFTNPRDLYFGEGARHEVKNFKGSKAVIVSGGSSMRRGGFLQDVQADLESAGMEVKLYEGCRVRSLRRDRHEGRSVHERVWQPTGLSPSVAARPSTQPKAMWIKYEYPSAPSRTCARSSVCPSCARRPNFCAISSTSGTSDRGHGLLDHHRLREGHQVPDR